MIIRIGKASDNDFVVNDPHVSRYHAKLIREEGGCWLLEHFRSLEVQQRLQRRVCCAEASLR